MRRGWRKQGAALPQLANSVPPEHVNADKHGLAPNGKELHRSCKLTHYFALFPPRKTPHLQRNIPLFLLRHQRLEPFPRDFPRESPQRSTTTQASRGDFTQHVANASLYPSTPSYSRVAC
ncbi:hypothetical protein IG631_20614 [Alternaria alternata]|nr:hypothetical protein IG631_20614 [Alternaria alternata]